jgi:uncharacterized membrane protein YgdD (TMEM256/DUF423 family)
MLPIIKCVVYWPGFHGFYCLFFHAALAIVESRNPANAQCKQLIHSVVLTLTAVVAPANTIAMSLFTAGMAMFSGSIYLLVLDAKKYKSVGPVTPIGGLCLIGGWIMLAARGKLVQSRAR